ncbi:aminomethyltransferase family protein [Halobellus limi]|uniref:Aminomethyl transferase family protein n=1 Tax=Halobellus limi TaxID=699433 RepID=A0A1H6BWK7_9EURY|nr:aminomethyltransferase family protein [Halobellus limi]QCC49435.1 aminomethyl transferase family protein [Halobellus limi]SEG64835.1 vanillate/3-O-methylgallate O-demethylase [Halobellus limi]
MADRSLQTALDAAQDPVGMLQQAGGRWVWPQEVKREYTNWMDELRAARETCVLADLSHHQMDQVIEGPDSFDLLKKLCTNSFEGFDVGKAKQAILCNPDGKFIGDGVLQRLEEQKFVMSGKIPAAHWLAYHAETGEYDVSETIYPKSSKTEDDPHFYTYQVQGPNALDVMQEIVEESLTDIPFFNFKRITIAGEEVRALRHGMAGEIGFELQGPYEHADLIKDVILEAGQEYDIQRLGTRAYEPLSVKLGWVTTHVPAIYTSEEMAAYREWLSASSYEGTYSIAGSYHSDDIRDYYVSPLDIGYDHMVEFDHEFIGREALEAEAADPGRTRVTLVWDDEDAIGIFASLFDDDTLPHKSIDLPRDRWGGHHDKVLKDGEVVGISKSFAYSYSDREMISICSIDREYSEPGTEVTFVWGEEGGQSPNPTVEAHSQTEISATVAPSPYLDDSR